MAQSLALSRLWLWIGHAAQGPGHLGFAGGAAVYSAAADVARLGLLAGIGGINKEINGVQSFAKVSDGLCVAYSGALTHKSSNVGQGVFSAIKTFVQAYVDKYAYEWLAEAVAYEYEMVESTKSD